MLKLLVFPHPICVCAALRKRYIECYTIGHLDVFFVHRDEHAASTQVDDEDLQKISRWMRRASQRAHTKDCSPTSVAASVSRCARKDATRVLDQTNAPHIDSLFGNGRAPLPHACCQVRCQRAKLEVSGGNHVIFLRNFVILTQYLKCISIKSKCISRGRAYTAGDTTYRVALCCFAHYAMGKGT